MKIVFDILRSLVSWVIVVILCIVFFPFFLLFASLPESWRRDNTIYFFLQSVLLKTVCWASFLPVNFEGIENIPDEPAIFAPNHLSAFDIPIVGCLLGNRPHVWLVLSVFESVPVFGYIARRMAVLVDISTPQKMMFCLMKAIKLVKGTGRNLIIFPEGGRAVDGKLQPFFPGVAVIAQSAELPVVPVYLHNLDKAFPIGSFLMRRYPITVRVGKPFRMQEGQSREQFLEQIYQWFLEQAKQ